jgi:shikimate kinase
MAAPRDACLQGIDRIVLTGFMGSGKTTSGGLLAERLGWRFLDLDREIERREGRTVAAIFAEDGESCFRRLETASLASLLGERKIVLALGGGTPEELGNRLLLEQTPRTVIVHLAAPLSVMVERCRKDATPRPLLEEAAALFRHRQHVYERIASHTVETAEIDAEQASAAILSALEFRAKR